MADLSASLARLGYATRRTRSSLGTPLLGRAAGSRRWRLLFVESPRPAGASRGLGFLWLGAQGAKGRPAPFFLCWWCEGLVVPFVWDARRGRAVAFGPALEVDGTVSWGRVTRRALGRTKVWVAERIRRYQGVVRRDLFVWRQRGKRLALAGSVPLEWTNEGACGSVAQVLERGRPYGKPSRCVAVVHFESRVHWSRRGAKSSERLVLLEVRRRHRRSRIEQRAFRRAVRWHLRHGRLAASRHSLLSRIPSAVVPWPQRRQ